MKKRNRKKSIRHGKKTVKMNTHKITLELENRANVNINVPRNAEIRIIIKKEERNEERSVEKLSKTERLKSLLISETFSLLYTPVALGVFATMVYYFSKLF